jgi:hypothetical protein
MSPLSWTPERLVGIVRSGGKNAPLLLLLNTDECLRELRARDEGGPQGVAALAGSEVAASRGSKALSFHFCRQFLIMQCHDCWQRL